MASEADFLLLKIRSGCQHCCSRPPAARSEFGRVGMLASKRVPAHLLLRVEGHCHDAARDAFMTFPPYTRTREGEAPQLGGGLTPCRQSFLVRKCPLQTYSILQ